MAYDGIFIKKEIEEIKSVVLNEHIAKITMSSYKVVNIHFRIRGENQVLTLNANPNFPHILLDTSCADNIKVPPAFCMLLRKYFGSAVIQDIYQVGFKSCDASYKDEGSLERIIKFTFENINEYGDIKSYYLFFEIMGKYSNLIATDENYIILDTLYKSRIGEGRLIQKNKYDISTIANKHEINAINFDEFNKLIKTEILTAEINKEKFDLPSAICKLYAGISRPYVISKIIDYIEDDFIGGDANYSMLGKITLDICHDENKLRKFFETFNEKIPYNPCINYKGDKPADFYLYKLNQFEGEVRYFDDLSKLLKTYITEKFSKLNDNIDKSNIEVIINRLYSRLNKKLDIYKKDLSKCEDLDKYKRFGELVSAFGYDSNSIKNGILTCRDYTNNDIEVMIPVDESISIANNVKKYYDKYNKLKRTQSNVEKLIRETISKIEHLNSIESSLTYCNDKNDLFLIKEELISFFDESKTISSLRSHNDKLQQRKSAKYKNKKITYNISHFKSSSGIDIYVGKNNLQNEYLTFAIADSNDTWLHIKDATGSHVIIKKSYDVLDDKTLVEAASLAAYFSEKRNETKATVDYTLRKELKKVKGKAPGFCIYHKNYSINVKPEILIKEV